MDRIKALDKLIDMVVAGIATRSQIEIASISALGPDQRCLDAGAAYMRDLNAAENLHMQELMGWEFELHEFDAEVWLELDNRFYASSVHTARSWLLAQLRAIRAREVERAENV